MTELIVSLAPLLLIDALNPILFALLVVAAGSGRPAANTTALLAGHTAAYFGAGVAIAYALDAITYRLDHPKPVDFVVELVVGLVCLWVLYTSRSGTKSDKPGDKGQMAPGQSFVIGAIINFVGMPFAIPYFAVISQILKADLSTGSSFVTLGIYNFLYALPFALVPVAVIVFGDRCRPMLARISGALTGLANKFMPFLLFAVAAALRADAIVFFVRGSSLF
jgi:cytochrome c biogenesis protein CcdA